MPHRLSGPWHPCASCTGHAAWLAARPPKRRSVRPKSGTTRGCSPWPKRPRRPLHPPQLHGRCA
eukprot:838063-Lingulodinium_polyedra.AAC.1